jgi:hypothetical protein
MKQPITLSQYDLSILRKSVSKNPNTIISKGNDNRPLQPVGSRVILSYEGTDAAVSTPIAAATDSQSTGGGRELTRDYASFSILILVPIIIFFALWWFGVFDNCKKRKPHTPVQVSDKPIDPPNTRPDQQGSIVIMNDTKSVDI